jgi:hypothetical protein
LIVGWLLGGVSEGCEGERITPLVVWEDRVMDDKRIGSVSRVWVGFGYNGMRLTGCEILDTPGHFHGCGTKRGVMGKV